MTNSAAKSPNTAPDAPTVRVNQDDEAGEDSRKMAVDPPTADRPYRAVKRHRPRTGSSTLPHTHRAHMLKARCTGEAWRKAVVTKRHGSSRASAGKKAKRLVTRGMMS